MHACYPLAKILWLKQNRPELFARIKYIGPIKDYLFHAFTGKFLIDCSAYESVRSILEGIAARAEGEPCCTYIGEDGAGHYVKMVHNGIEYADMQIIAETYLILKHVGGLLNARIGEIFHAWNSGELQSYLIGITADIFAEVDAETGAVLVDIIVDRAGQKGTGRWTSLDALTRGVDLSMISAACNARVLSNLTEERAHAGAVMTAPEGAAVTVDADFIEAVRRSLYTAKIVAYAQGKLPVHALRRTV